MARNRVILHFTGLPGSSDLDQLGFVCPWSRDDQCEQRQQYDKWYAQYLPVVVRRQIRWEKMDPLRERVDLLPRFIRKGVPQKFRKIVWLHDCPRISDGRLERHQVPGDVVNAIRLDIPRTFPDNVFLRTETTRNALGRILFTLAEHVPSVGYCQGLNFVAGIIMLVVDDESRAADLLVHMVSQRKDYYGRRMIGWRRDAHVLHKLLRRFCPRVIVTLERLDVGLDLLIGKWFLCWFVESLPMETVLRIWDVLIYEGDVWLFRIAVSLFRSNMMAIADCTSFEEVLTRIEETQASDRALDCHNLILNSTNPGITPQLINELREEAAREIVN